MAVDILLEGSCQARSDMSDIFISYAREDREAARRLAGALEEQGWSVFWDPTIPAGMSWREVIAAALADARSVVVLWSQHSVKSPYVIDEAEHALRRRVLIPVFVERVEPPFGFGSIQVADLSEWRGNRQAVAVQRFFGDVAGILGPAPVVSAEQLREAEAKRRAEEQRQQAEAEAKRRAEQVAVQGLEQAKQQPDKEAGSGHPVQDTESTAIGTPVPPPQRSILPSLGIFGSLVIMLAIGFVLQSRFSTTEPRTAAEATTLDTGDTAWVIAASILPLATVIPALALFYGGLTGTRDLRFVFGRVLSVFAITIMVWVAWAYSLCFSEGNEYIGGFSRILLAGVGGVALLSPTIPEYVFVFYSMANACMIAAMVAGALVGRVTFPALLLFTALWITFVFSPITYWIWGGGWLGRMGVLDFAGGLNSFVAAGAAGVIGSLIIGAPANDGKKLTRSDENMTLLGASLLWLGWFGLIAGSYLQASINVSATILNIITATLAATLAWFLMDWIVTRQSSPLRLMWGAIAGLAAFTPAAGFVVLTGSIVLGIVSALARFVFAVAIKRRDALLMAFGTYLIGGIVGTLGTGVFAVETLRGTSGLLEGNPHQVIVQGWGVLFTLAWSAGVTFVILFVIKLMGGLQIRQTAGREVRQ